MSAAHTPGPWAVCEHSWCETSISAPGFDHAVCSLDINHATEESQAADEAVMAANARLISAAPELLRVAEMLVEALADDSDSLVFGVKLGVAHGFARAAIAKATGGAQ